MLHHVAASKGVLGEGRERAWALATLGLLAVYAVVGLAVVGSYGITYDESWHAQNGQFVLDWYTSGFADRTFERFGTLRFYGVLFDLPAAVVQKLTGGDLYAIRHVWNLCFAVITVAGVASIAAELSGPAAAFFATLTLVLTPRFFGHGFNNGKDVPLAAGTVWAALALVRFVRLLPRPPASAIIALGAAWGLALAVRLTALSLVMPMAAGAAAWWLASRPRPGVPDVARGLVPALTGAALIAAIVALPFWPVMIVDPVHGLTETLGHQWQAGLGGTIPVLYNGQWLHHLDVPATYVWAWLARITPEFYAVALLLAALAAWRSRPWSRDALTGWSIVLTAALCPLVLATITRPALYDALRHFLFATVLLAVPAGAGCAWGARHWNDRTGSGSRWIARAGLMLAAGGAGVTLADMVRLHPYETTYFNRAVAGGLAGADGRWDTDYWGNSFREGTLWLVQHAPADPAHRPRVASSAYPTQTEHYLPEDRFEYVGSIDQTPELMVNRYADPPDYYVSFTRWGRDQAYPGEVIHRVMRDGVTLLVVVKVDREKAKHFRPPPSP